MKTAKDLLTKQAEEIKTARLVSLSTVQELEEPEEPNATELLK